MPRLRWMTAGESHGPSMTVLLDGIPSGVALSAEEIDRDLARRQRGYGRGGRMKIEHDQVQIEAGVRDGRALGSPLCLRVVNRDHENWKGRMGAERLAPPPEPMTLPRPGHADLAGALKYDTRDVRNVLERASARETVARVAAGAAARALLTPCGVVVVSRVREIAGERDDAEYEPSSVYSRAADLDASELRALDPEHDARMRAAIHALSHRGETAGGVVEVVALGVPPGLGSCAQWDLRLDGRLAQAAMSVPAIKAVEIGDGWAASARAGSLVHDPIGYDADERRFTRASNHAGGIEGGMSNGEAVVLRAAMKPLPTLRKPLASVDLVTKRAGDAAVERSDICAVPAAGIVLEAMMLLVLADAVLEKFGGDTLGDLLTALEAYRARVRAF